MEELLPPEDVALDELGGNIVADVGHHLARRHPHHHHHHQQVHMMPPLQENPPPASLPCEVYLHDEGGDGGELENHSYSKEYEAKLTMERVAKERMQYEFDNLLIEFRRATDELRTLRDACTAKDLVIEEMNARREAERAGVVAECTERVAASEAKRKKAHELLEEERVRCKQLFEEVEYARKETENERRLRLQQDDHIASLQSELAQSEATCQRQSECAQETRQELRRVMNEMDELKLSNSEAQKELFMEKEVLKDEYEARISELVKRVSDAETLLRESKLEHESKCKELRAHSDASLQMAKLDKESECRELRSRLSEMQDTMNHLHARYREMSETLSRSQSESDARFSALQKKNQELESTVSVLEAGRKAFEDATLRAYEKKFQQGCAQMSQELEQTKKQLLSMQRDVLLNNSSMAKIELLEKERDGYRDKYHFVCAMVGDLQIALAAAESDRKDCFALYRSVIDNLCSCPEDEPVVDISYLHPDVSDTNTGSGRSRVSRRDAETTSPSLYEIIEDVKEGEIE